ncbi:protein of unknown function [Methylocella tundrae]|uniref:Uncharacterized protein n=1 Tax=Methylocella tundrae TaxID=227605 RepID=A0A4U8YZ37_METTU|nr:protein of unknown function [Methylocella tundrae]
MRRGASGADARACAFTTYASAIKLPQDPPLPTAEGRADSIGPLFAIHADGRRWRAEPRVQSCGRHQG